MEIQYPSFPFLFTLLLSVYFLLKIVRRSKTNTSTSKLPPGPWKLPLIGNLHQIANSLPHRALRDLAKKHGPLMSLQLGQVLTIIVSSAEIAKEVLKTHDIAFASRHHIIATEIMSYNSTNLVFAPYGPYWRKLRKICVTVLLSHKRVMSSQAIRHEEVSNLIRYVSLNAGSSINLSKKIFLLAYGVTSRIAFGRRFIDEEKFIAVVEEILKVVGEFNIADFYPRAKWLHNMSGVRPKLERYHKEVDRIMGRMIDQHITLKVTGKEREDDDLVDALLEYHQDSETDEFSLTIGNIKAVILDIFAVGSETTASTIDWAMAEIVKNPRIKKKAQAEVRRLFGEKGDIDETYMEELKYLKLIIKETLRLHPPVRLLPRECGEICEIDGYVIPMKAKVFVNAWAIARDPNIWEDPESFIPERFLDSTVDFKGNNFEYIPFGAGRRICPGISFGLANVEFELAQLLFHFDWKLPDGMKQEEMDMTEDFRVTVRRKQELNIVPIPLKNCTS